MHSLKWATDYGVLHLLTTRFVAVLPRFKGLTPLTYLNCTTTNIPLMAQRIRPMLMSQKNNGRIYAPYTPVLFCVLVQTPLLPTMI